MGQRQQIPILARGEPAQRLEGANDRLAVQGDAERHGQGRRQVRGHDLGLALQFGRGQHVGPAGPGQRGPEHQVARRPANHGDAKAHAESQRRHHLPARGRALRELAIQGWRVEVPVERERDRGDHHKQPEPHVKPLPVRRVHAAVRRGGQEHPRGVERAGRPDDRRVAQEAQVPQKIQGQEERGYQHDGILPVLQPRGRQAEAFQAPRQVVADDDEVRHVADQAE
mmetsp:Transcript_47111/g.143148  ORF Transcript_47111/g.143148 Transcript_47111/m.143148 type:complete len:226 (+) Transcript_47111:398-1075(+)